MPWSRSRPTWYYYSCASALFCFCLDFLSFTYSKKYKWVGNRHFTPTHIRRWVSHRQSPWKHTDGVQLIKRNFRDEKRPTWEEYKCTTTCLTAEEALLYALIKLNIISNSCLTEVLAGMQNHNIRTAHVPYRTLATMYPPPTQWAFVPPESELTRR